MLTSIEGLILSLTGHVSAISFMLICSFSSNMDDLGHVKDRFRTLILLGFIAMIFSVLITRPISLVSNSFARMAMVVIMQEAKAVPTKSVGENLSPFPWLSNGASVSKWELECK